MRLPIVPRPIKPIFMSNSLRIAPIRAAGAVSVLGRCHCVKAALASGHHLNINNLQHSTAAYDSRRVAMSAPLPSAPGAPGGDVALRHVPVAIPA